MTCGPVRPDALDFDALWDREERREGVLRMVRVLADQVRRSTPAELRCWPGTLELVEGPRARLIEAADAYVAGNATKLELVEAAEGVRDAWREAGRRWLLTGKTEAASTGAPDA